MFKNILIPTDGSEMSEDAARKGAALAKLHGARIVGVHVFPVSLGIYYGEAVWVDETMRTQMQEAAAAEGRKYLDKLEEIVRAEGVPFERVLIEGDSPWQGIVETADRKGCDLIVMAAHGRRGIAAVLLGSETNRVLTHTKIPVLVYR
ncbi:MAG TPA: universal stress protein [Burkholderiales bacterium]